MNDLSVWAVITGALLVFFALAKGARIKKVKAGPLEFEAKEDSVPQIAQDIKGMQKSLHNESLLVKKIGKKLDRLIAEVNDLDTDHLKMFFRSSDQPVVERLLAGLRYLYKGENGDMGKAIIKMARGNLAIYEALCAAKPEYKISELEKNKEGGHG
ncbi:MAG: hypothetical protein LBC99_06560 [Spirochaetota bacterium]|nr:hypothetical protein [Spirochaetota bacterium]